MRKLLNFENNIPTFLSSASAVGKEEHLGPLGNKFDIYDGSDLYGMNTFEKAEAEMNRTALNLALKKAGLQPSQIDILLAGDLDNQCTATSSGLYSFGIPYIGLYSACSTCTEALLLLSLLISKTNTACGAVVTSSHNSAAERQFRTPVEYGGQRTPTAQWTATASGAFIMNTGGKVGITEGMFGKIVDGTVSDASNMGAAMARSAFDTLYTYFKISGHAPSDFDFIVTGDLGHIGSEILCEMLAKEVSGAEKIHTDCGKLIYDKSKKDVHGGGSGCGCSASVLASHFLPMLERGEIKDILFLSTGALMSPGSVLQGENILGITPLIHIKGLE